MRELSHAKGIQDTEDGIKPDAYSAGFGAYSGWAGALPKPDMLPPDPWPDADLYGNFYSRQPAIVVVWIAWHKPK